ncbi:MAG: hydroxymethylbilane synthase [Magnetococcales bacterium]|nr:hydroxymethylbilane synthase [Magnetococcales bacterium]
MPASTNTIRIGTRGSLLALWQAKWVRGQLIANNPDLSVELVIIKTKGDKILDVPLAKVGGKGLFVKELEEAMLDGRTDIAVHSMKDVPSEFPEGLGLATVLEREDPRDALLSVNFNGLDDLPKNAKVGSSSLRRQAQILNIRPDLEIIPLRGNVNTRIDKLKSGAFDAIILAAAGVKRLEMTDHVVEWLDPNRMIPAAGQGAVGVETRINDTRILSLLAPLDHHETHVRVLAERSFLHKLEGGCQVPIAAHARLDGDTLSLRGRVGSLDGATLVTMEKSAPISDAVQLGIDVGEALLEQGAGEILNAVITETS